MSLIAGRVALVLAPGGTADPRLPFGTGAVPALVLDAAGLPGDPHHGLARLSGPREPWMPRGLTLRNDRQLTALSLEEIAAMAVALDLGHADPAAIAGALGTNLVTSGLPALSRLAAGSHLALGGAWGRQGRFDGTAILKCEAYNNPCRKSGRNLALAFGRPDLEFAFPKAAASLRGLVLSVAMAGTVAAGDTVVAVPPVTAP